MTSGSLEALYHGWLAAVLPADAQTVRTQDPHLAATLRDAGAAVSADSHGADVGIGLPGGEDTVLVPLGANARLTGTTGVRAVRRLRRGTQLRLTAREVSKQVASEGYRTEVLLWDFFRRMPLPGASGVVAVRAADRFPLHAVVRGVRGPVRPTALAAAADEAERVTGRPLGLVPPVVASGVLVGVGEQDVLRCVVGPLRRPVLAAQAALQRLDAQELPPELRCRVPAVHGTGRAGLVDWAVESRLPGRTPPPALSAKLLEDCVDFLVALHQLAKPCGPEPRLLDAAQAVTPDGGLAAWASAADAALADLPRGFGHGDFWSGNLLAEGDRLTGVVDWDAAGPGRLPLLDLVHLQLRRENQGSADAWGSSLVRQVLPALRAGGDARTRAYCAALGLRPDPALLEQLLVAYWLDRLAYQLHRSPSRRHSGAWFEVNVRQVAAGLR